MDKLDFKKTDKELYSPKTEPSILQVSAMNFIMVDGHGNPNDEDGEHSKAVELLYALTYTIKMGRKSENAQSEDFTDYVVAPLEGLWWFNDLNEYDFINQKDKYCWTSMIRQPDFITREIFEKAKDEVKKKKPQLDVTKARLETFEEGLCVQCMHIGPYDKEPATVAKIYAFVESHGMKNGISTQLPDGSIRRHHEIYLADPRKSNPATMKTVLRHPVMKID
jgi:hypothetical protein